MRAVDTNVLLRLIIRDDSRQAAAAETFIEKGAWVSLLVLTEAIWVLTSTYKSNAKDTANAIEMLLDHRELVVQDPETVAQALELFRARPALGFSDCLILEVARAQGHIPLGTFDRNLGKLAGAQRL